MSVLLQNKSFNKKRLCLLILMISSFGCYLVWNIQDIQQKFIPNRTIPDTNSTLIPLLDPDTNTTLIPLLDPDTNTTLIPLLDRNTKSTLIPLLDQVTKSKIILLLDPDINSRLSENPIARNSKPVPVYEGNIWVILETEKGPSTSDKRFCNNSGYSVLIIGNDLYRTQWRKAKCRFHGTSDQTKLKFKSSIFPKNSNYSSTARKNIGILYAIQQGATVIYDLKTISDFINIDFNHKWCLRYSGPENFNPFLHFQIVNAGNRSDSLTYNLTDCKQTVVSVLPSINLVHTTSYPSNKHVNHAAPSISVSRDLFLHFVPESQIYHRDSFWNSVTFPKTTMTTAMFTSYWKQYLLHQVGEDLSVISREKTSYRDHNFHFNITDSRYHTIFHSETCNGHISISQCAIKLAKLLVQYKIWEPSNLVLLSAWFDDLYGLNYTLPVLDLKVNEDSTAVIRYSPKVALKNQNITSICDKQVLKTASKQIDDILLLIVFNHPIYKHVGFLHELYSRTFTNIIYCGENSTLFQSDTQHLDYNLTFIEQHVDNGFQIYKCVSVAMKIDYKVSGILMLSDDVLFNVWNVWDLPTDKPWTGQIGRLRLGEQNIWGNWQKWFGEKAFTSAWNEIISDQKHQHTENKTSEYLTDYLQIENRLNILGNSTKTVVFGIEDIAYFPRTMSKDFIYYGDIFAKHKLFLEIAIPVLIGGLTERDDIFLISGSYLWGSDRVAYQPFYNRSHLFFHPFKWGVELQKNESRQFLCNEYFPYL